MRDICVARHDLVIDSKDIARQFSDRRVSVISVEAQNREPGVKLADFCVASGDGLVAAGEIALSADNVRVKTGGLFIRGGYFSTQAIDLESSCRNCFLELLGIPRVHGDRTPYRLR